MLRPGRTGDAQSAPGRRPGGARPERSSRLALVYECGVEAISGEQGQVRFEGR